MSASSFLAFCTLFPFPVCGLICFYSLSYTSDEHNFVFQLREQLPTFCAFPLQGNCCLSLSTNVPHTQLSWKPQVEFCLRINLKYLHHNHSILPTKRPQSLHVDDTKDDDTVHFLSFLNRISKFSSIQFKKALLSWPTYVYIVLFFRGYTIKIL